MKRYKIMELTNTLFDMSQVVSITSQGQLTVPKSVLKYFGIDGSTKAELDIIDQGFVVKPKLNFWSLRGAAKSKIKLNDTQLREARDAFAKKWAKE